MNAEFATYGIHRNGLIARINHTQLDYHRWTVTDGKFNGIREKVLKCYYPKWITDNDNVLVKFVHDHQTVPLSWVVPTKKWTLPEFLWQFRKSMKKFSKHATHSHIVLVYSHHTSGSAGYRAGSLVTKRARNILQNLN